MTKGEEQGANGQTWEPDTAGRACNREERFTSVGLLSYLQGQFRPLPVFFKLWPHFTSSQARSEAFPPPPFLNKRMTRMAMVQNIFLTVQNAHASSLGTSTLSVCCLLDAHDQQYTVFLIIRLFHKDKNRALLECLAQLMVWLMETWTWNTADRRGCLTLHSW